MKKIILLLVLQFSALMAVYIIEEGKPLIRVDTKESGVKSVKEYGAIGDGMADDTLAIQKAINSETKLFFPEGRYRVSNSIYPRSGTVLISDNASIYYTKEHGVAALWPAFYFENSIHNVDMLGHWIFEGDTPNSKFNKALASPDDSYVQGIKIKENCSNIFIESFEGFNFSGGALEIGTDDPATPPPGNIIIDKIKVYNCWNVNMSITSGTDIHIKNIETYGALSNPNYAQAGVDIEVNTPNDVLENIQIDKIITHSNETGFQILTMTQSQRGVTVNEIDSFDNSDNGITLENVTDCTIKQMNVHDNKGAGLYLDGTFKNIALDSGSIYNNQNHGVLAQMNASAIRVSSENLNLAIDIYNNHGYGVLLSGTDEYPVKKFISTGKVYDNQDSKTQLTGIDIQKNVLDVNITGEVYGNKYFQIRH